jgi:Glycosyl transferases group 1
VEEEAQLARGFNPPEQHRLWRDRILPRTVIPLYWLYKAALFPSFVFGRKPRQVDLVAIESGKIGWTHVYFEELEGSASDFFGPHNVLRQVIDRDAPYFPQFRKNQCDQKPSLVIIDVRTPTQTWRAALVETFRMSHLLLRQGVTPLVVLTDAYYRRHRWQAAVLTAYRGSVVTFSAEEIVRKIFPHDRLVGPLFMPISRRRIQWLEEHKTLMLRNRKEDSPIHVAFIGSMYSPRDAFLDAVQERLVAKGIHLEINGDKAGTSNDQYWNTLINADVIVTTTLQGPQRAYMDWVWIRQAVFRYSETLAAGTALVAGKVDGGFPYFDNERDFLEFDSVDQCVSAIEELVRNAQARSALADRGHATISEYVQQGTFWKVSLDAMKK